jgi:hypothetical protein
MKMFGRFLLLMALYCLVCACTDDWVNDHKWETQPFNASFTGEYLYSEQQPDDCKCGPWDPDIGECWGLVTNAGEGTEISLGHLEFHFEFCCNFVTGIHPGTCCTGYFTADNADRLEVMFSAAVLEGRLDEHPDYVNSWWRDSWEITGGTGQFEGASGSGFTDDFNSDFDPYSHHHWTGNITLLKKIATETKDYVSDRPGRK